MSSSSSPQQPRLSFKPSHFPPSTPPLSPHDPSPCIGFLSGFFSRPDRMTVRRILKRKNPASNADYFGALKKGSPVCYRPESSRDDSLEANNEMVVGGMERAHVSVVANHFLSVPSNAPCGYTFPRPQISASTFSPTHNSSLDCIGRSKSCSKDSRSSFIFTGFSPFLLPLLVSVNPDISIKLGTFSCLWWWSYEINHR
ncbi:hypothetical protein SCHPADRAFT_17593 [Schizopora paradoxa]|uniref:Uncharacterized protein n=1 Tax=Schizopora paradoxa TaxID=27342 RepID=A0A0H2SA01_9AGAM|nr:hypothetical protein SCHPADRAFT_17593 [Schizopora paradoxa]